MINWLLSIKQSIIRLIPVWSGYSSSGWCNRIRYLFPDLAADGQISMINTWCLGEAPRLMTGLTVQAIDKIWNIDARDIILHAVYLRKSAVINMFSLALKILAKLAIFPQWQKILDWKDGFACCIVTVKLIHKMQI